MRRLHKNHDLVADIKRRWLGWLGYLIKMDQTRVAKKLHESNPDGGRGREWFARAEIEEVEATGK
jgi:hypothetical protein